MLLNILGQLSAYSYSQTLTPSSYNGMPRDEEWQERVERGTSDLEEQMRSLDKEAQDLENQRRSAPSESPWEWDSKTFDRSLHCAVYSA